MCSSDLDDALEVLHDVSLDVAAGKRIAIVGASGSGKSTLIQLADNLGGAIRDPLAVEAALHPESIRQFLPINLTVETQGPTRGRTVSTMEKLREKKTRTQVCLNLDGETFVKRFADTIREFIR